jgi:peptidyl-prolyl cis-trans isomerase SurA
MTQAMPRNALPIRLAAILGLWLAALAPALAQSPFETVARVNESIITRFEVTQRQRLRDVLRRPERTREAALDGLIDDRLRMQAAREAGITPTEEDITFGVEDFAARANLTGEEFVAALEDAGIARESIRDFIAVRIAWGEVLRERFAARARPGEAEIDRALALGTGAGNARVLLSEIVLPLDPQTAEISRERAAAIAEFESFEQFSSAARRFSIAPSSANGGRLDWLPLSDLPEQLAPRFLSLQPGDVTEPLVLDRGIALFQLRALEDTAPPIAQETQLDYARLRFPPGQDLAAEAARVTARADTCDDLYGVAKGQPEEVLERGSKAPGEIPTDIAMELAKLDKHEVSTALTRAGGWRTKKRSGSLA